MWIAPFCDSAILILAIEILYSFLFDICPEYLQTDMTGRCRRLQFGRPSCHHDPNKAVGATFMSEALRYERMMWYQLYRNTIAINYQLCALVAINAKICGFGDDSR